MNESDIAAEYYTIIKTSFFFPSIQTENEKVYFSHVDSDSVAGKKV